MGSGCKESSRSRMHCLMGRLQQSPQEQFSMEISFAEEERFTSLCTKALLTAGRLCHLGDCYFGPISVSKFMADDFNTFTAVPSLYLSFPCLEMAMPLLDIFDQTV